ncbi:MAG: hypothetical protein ACK4P8_09795 [Tabrizicola sp.]
MREEAADRLDLVFLLLLGVGEFQVDAQFRRDLPGHAGLGRAPAGFRPDLRKADDLSGQTFGTGCRKQQAAQSRAKREGLKTFMIFLPMETLPTLLRVAGGDVENGNTIFRKSVHGSVTCLGAARAGAAWGREL